MGRRFWRAAIAYLVNSIGDQFSAVALPLSRLQLGYAASTTTFLQSVTVAATVVSGFLIGHVVDQHRPVPLLGWSYVASAAVLIVGLAATVLGLPGYPVALAMAATLGLLAAITAAAIDAGVPGLVTEPSHIRRGYSLIEALRSSAAVLGPAAAVVVALVRGLPAVFGLNATSFLLAAVVMGTGHLRRARRCPHDHPAARTPDDPPAAVKLSMRQAVTEGFRVIVRDHRLRLGVALSVTINITLGAVDSLVLVRLVRDFQLCGDQLQRALAELPPSDRRPGPARADLGDVSQRRLLRRRRRHRRRRNRPAVRCLLRTHPARGWPRLHRSGSRRRRPAAAPRSGRCELLEHRWTGATKPSVMT